MIQIILIIHANMHAHTRTLIHTHTQIHIHTRCVCCVIVNNYKSYITFCSDLDLVALPSVGNSFAAVQNIFASLSCRFCCYFPAHKLRLQVPLLKTKNERKKKERKKRSQGDVSSIRARAC